MNDLTTRAVSEVLAAQIIIECMKQVVPYVHLAELSIKIESIGRSGGADSPFREKERDAVLLAAGMITPSIHPFPFVA